MKQYNRSKVNTSAFLLGHQFDTTMARLYRLTVGICTSITGLLKNQLFLGAVIWCNEPTPATSVDLSDHPKGLLKYV